jgi:cobalt-precorrin-5B (C1)-methyltransferase
MRCCSWSTAQMTKKKLKYGYTTGACAAAAAKGAALTLRCRRRVDEVTITLPHGETAVFRLAGQQFSENSASCYVIKDAGDDPDVTNGAEIHVTVTLQPRPPSPQPSPTGGEGANIIIQGGPGIGRITKPGLAVPVGEWAINPVPRKMITEAVYEAFFPLQPTLIPVVTISIPNGEELAKKTLNARLGIIDGLSILGTTGIVKPISTQAWTDTIEAAIDVALACGCETLVLSTGRTSEHAAQNFFPRLFPEEACIMMGDHVGHAVRACARKGVGRIILAAQFAKLLKIACGHEQTHVASSKLDLPILAGWLETAHYSASLITHALQANTAREVLEISGYDTGLIDLVCKKAEDFVAQLAPGIHTQVLLAGYGGEVLYCRCV